ncbi:MAG TPA: glycoside hydrolase family 97 protein [Vicinamibacterales bacterium]|nr:glycoside hydrolase family 97 protein [Vicinamibacterales bacterium]
MRTYAGFVTLVAACSISLAAQSAAAQRARKMPAGLLTVASPSGAIVATVGTTGGVTWSVSMKGRQIVKPSPIAMTLDNGRVLGGAPVAVGTTTRSADRVLKPVVRVKRAEIRDHFNERRVDFAGGYALLVRAYDDGVAYRWATTLPGDVTVIGEDATITFADDYPLWFPEETSFQSHQERQYKRLSISELQPGQFSSLPAMADLGGGAKAVITEADLLDYPGMDLMAGPEPGSLKGLFPAYPKQVEAANDRDEKVAEREPYIAKTRGTREYPWRVLVLAERDADLLGTDIVYRLASETTMDDTSWIAPGKVAWDWWNDLNITGVPFRAGVNTDTYKHYIDFAAENGLQYIILDEGWYRLGDLLSVVPGLDMEAVAAHAKQKNVGLIMWVIWKTLDRQMQPALDQFARWGVKGIKVDFMQREDQWMVNYYERVAREAAARRLLVDFHGSYKPTGLYRTWPNVITSEGVLGLEQSKWGDMASPDHAVTFPFMRMLAGPVDYTPGAMVNSTKRDFRPVYNRPGSQGTRCQQLAMYVAFESPLQMLADSPSHYRREPESLAFLSAVPTVWDETKPLDAKVGEYLLVARRSGREWYVGALTNWSARDLEVDLSFLGEGSFEAEIFRDGVNADRNALDYARERQGVTAQSRLQVHLAPGGGFAARIVPR